MRICETSYPSNHSWCFAALFFVVFWAASVAAALAFARIAGMSSSLPKLCALTCRVGLQLRRAAYLNGDVTPLQEPAWPGFCAQNFGSAKRHVLIKRPLPLGASCRG